MRIINRLGAVATAIAFVSTLSAQALPDRSVNHWVGTDSGYVSNTNTAPAALGMPLVVWSTVVTIPQAAWIRLNYAGVLLSGADEPGSNGSYLKITSLRDGYFQTQHLEHIEQWRETSAYFNGDSVIVELYAYPGTGENRLIIGDVTASPLTGEDTICGPTDDRVLSSDPRAARNRPTGCTSWMIDDCNHCFLTAGHCTGNLQTVQFNVPLSTSSGSSQNPPPSDQYAVDASSLQSNGGQGTGNDWAYFGVFPNSTTGLTPYQANGGLTYALQATPPAVNGQNIRITGYGSTSSPVSPTWNVVQKTHAGPYFSFSGTTVRYTTDTTGGNSGSPVIIDGTNPPQAIGIHTHGGCSSTSGSNIGTGSNHSGLQNALANPQGVCDCPGLVFSYPNGLPDLVQPDGSTTIQVDVSGPVTLQAGSVLFHVSIGGTFQVLTPASLGGSLFEATVPASPCLTNVQFYFSAQDTSNVTYTDPRQAPTSIYSAISGEGVSTIRSYNFNTTPPSWSVINTNLSTGAWVRGAPLDPRGPSSDFDASGQCWVTGNTNNQDVDGGPTVLRTETFDLSGASDPYVHHALWFETTGSDTMLVQASQNGGGSWTTIEILSADQGWEMHSFRVRDYFTNLNQIVVRYSIADQPNNSVTEGAVDAFRIDDILCNVATWTPLGSGCSATTAPSLTLVNPPQAGTTFQLLASSLGGGAAFMVTGLSQQNLPLQQFGFGSGCSLLVTNDAVEFLPQAFGLAFWNLQIPNSPAFAGLHLYNQVVELGAQRVVTNAGDGEIQ